MSHIVYQEWCKGHFRSEEQQRIKKVLSEVSLGKKYRGACKDTAETMFTIQSINEEYITFTDNSRIKTEVFNCFYTPWYGG